jgi:hypothetical protein
MALALLRSTLYEMLLSKRVFISFCYGFPLKGMKANNRFREGSRGVMKISAVSLR